MTENVFQVFRANGRRCPFVVQRTTSRSCIYLVTEVQARGQYGEAYGYPLPAAAPLVSAAYPPNPVNPHYGTTGVVGPVKNAGCYQWVLVTREWCPADWPDEWKAACPPPE